MNIVYVASAVVGILLAIWLTVVIAKAYSRSGTVSAAVKTVELLQAQVATLTATHKSEVRALTEQNTEQAKQIAALVATVKVLEGQVTQAAPVRELAAKQAERHEENILLLTRLEGSLSRVESKIMRGE